MMQALVGEGRFGMACNGGAIILAGGKSTRFGRDKAFEPLAGKTLIEHVAEVLRGLFPDVMIVANAPRLFQRFDLAVASDVIPGAGSLGGILTGLLHSGSDRCFVAACDMPFLKADLIAELYERSVRYDVVVPVVAGEPEPLHAVYSKRCIRPIVRMISEGQYRIVGLYKRVSVLKVGEEEWKPFDPEGASFFNINTPSDFGDASGLLQRDGATPRTVSGCRRAP